MSDSCADLARCDVYTTGSQVWAVRFSLVEFPVCIYRCAFLVSQWFVASLPMAPV